MKWILILHAAIGQCIRRRRSVILWGRLLLSSLWASSRTLMVCLIIIHNSCLMRGICLRFFTAWCLVILWTWILAIIVIFIFFFVRIFTLITRATIAMGALGLLFTWKIAMLFFNRAHSRYLVKYTHAFLSDRRISISIEETCPGCWAYAAHRVTYTAITWWIIHAAN